MPVWGRKRLTELLLQPCLRTLDVEGLASHENRFADLPAGRHATSIRARFGRAVDPPILSKDRSATEQSVAPRRSARVQTAFRPAQVGSAGHWHAQRGA